MDDRWSLPELLSELERFEDELRRAGLKENSIRTYVDRSSIFLRWLAGDYAPRAGAGRLGPSPAEIKDMDAFRRFKAGGQGVVVVTDEPTRAVIAHLPSCAWVTEEAFEQKVVEGSGRTGRYYWLRSFEDAKNQLAARPCSHCG